MLTSKNKMFPGFDCFYRLGDPQNRMAYYGDTDEDACALTRGELRRTEPIVVTHAMGGAKPKEFIYAAGLHKIIGPRVIELLRKKQFTGWDLYPVTVYGKDGHVVPGYAGLSVVGRCGPLMDERSGRTMKQMPGGVFEYRVGHYFDEASWDGSDFFIPANTLFVFVHERVKQALEKSKITNVRFDRIDRMEWRELSK